ncbi:MAG: hypothetical protein NTW28_12670 [Candidatus Solibacter sp.]|nr:hypothetical protein [Candidatus Solibacter sp.]
MKRLLLSIAAVVPLLAVIGVFTARESIAQAIRAAWVRDADNAARHAVAFDLTAGGNYTVPAGKTLVIEDVSVFNLIPADPTSGLITVTNGVTLFHDMPFSPISGKEGATRIWAGGRTTRFYADPGSVVSSFSNGSFHMACSGYLIEVNP